jgi:hypothetical protein
MVKPFNMTFVLASKVRLHCGLPYDNWTIRLGYGTYGQNLAHRLKCHWTQTADSEERVGTEPTRNWLFWARTG